MTVVSEPRFSVQERLLTIQILRVVAASAVVFHHARDRMGYFDGMLNLGKFEQGTLGVDVFFVISGLIMVWMTKKNEFNPIEFIVRRFFRVWPLYFAVTLVLVIEVAIFPGWYAGPLDFIYIVKSILFIPTNRPEYGGLYPFLVPGWSLNLEIIFYIIFGISLATRNKYIVTSIVMTVIFLIFSRIGSGPIAATYGGHNAILLEFLVGMFIGAAYIGGSRLPPLFAWLLLVAGFVDLVVFGEQGLLGAGLASGLIVLGAVNIPLDAVGAANRWIDLLGRASFALYLIHNPIIQAAGRALSGLGYGPGDMNGWMFFALVLSVSLVASVFVHLWVELPLTRLFGYVPLQRRRPWESLRTS